MQNAIIMCSNYGLKFDAVNQNMPEVIERFGGDSRKIYADEYIDDKASNKFRLPYAYCETNYLSEKYKFCDSTIEMVIKGSLEVTKQFINNISEKYSIKGVSKFNAISDEENSAGIVHMQIKAIE